MQEFNPPPDSDSDYVSSDDMERNDFREVKPNKDFEDIDLEEQTQIIESFFNETQEHHPNSVPHEIKEVDSESSIDTERKVENSIINKMKDYEAPPIIDPLSAFKNEDLIKREESLAKSLFSDIRQKAQPKVFPAENNKHSLEKVNILIRDKSNKVINENPYSDNKIRTTYIWNNENEVFKSVKGSQNLFNDSIKRKNYFYPHIGIGGGAGNIFKTTSKTRMTLDVIRRPKIPTGSSCSKTKPKMKDHKRFENSMNRTGKNNALFPTVLNNRLNTGQIEKSLLCTGIGSKMSFKATNILNDGQLSTTVDTTKNNKIL